MVVGYGAYFKKCKKQLVERNVARQEQTRKEVMEMADIWEKKRGLYRDNPETIRAAFERQTESLYEGDFSKYASGDYVNEVQQYQWKGFHDGWNAALTAQGGRKA